MRLFYAIPLPDDVKAHLIKMQHAVSWGLVVGMGGDDHVKWIPSRNMHITLKFVGEVEDEHLPQFQSILKTVAMAPKTLWHDRVSCFPPKGPVNVIVAELGGEIGTLTVLANHLDQACENLGIPRERKPFRSHITIGRAKGTVRATAIETIATRFIKTPGPAFVPREVVLYESDLRKDGPVYTAIDRCELS
jgi:RNA 2',3'-cyclic 3'-phosphodiesterase